jgi:hypothetical protein
MVRRALRDYFAPSRSLDQGVILAGEHLRGRLQDILGELPLAGQRPLSEVAGACDELLRLRQPLVLAVEGLEGI